VYGGLPPNTAEGVPQIVLVILGLMAVDDVIKRISR
jgi:hypothetical protein